MNILYICNPIGIHDLKWISFFSTRSDIKQFVIWEDTFNISENKPQLSFFKEKGITVLPSYPSFSLKRVFNTFKNIKSLNQLIKTHHIDCIHILFTTPHALYSPFLKAPVILTTRGSDILKVIPGLRMTKGIKSWHDKILFNIFKHSFQKASFITTTSQKQLEWVGHLFSIVDKCHLVRTGVDVERISKLSVQENLPAPLNGIKFIFSPRWMFPQYNVETQIAAIKLLNKSILDEYTFVFIHGKDEFTDPNNYFLKMQEELKRVEGLKYIIFERLSQLEVWACFKQAKLTIMIPFTDGTPNSALEAMAARCKLIMGNADYDSILFDDTCLRVDTTNAHQLSQAIETAISNYPEHLLDNALERVTKFGNRTIEMNKILKLYYKTLNNLKT